MRRCVRVKEDESHDTSGEGALDGVFEVTAVTRKEGCSLTTTRKG